MNKNIIGAAALLACLVIIPACTKIVPVDVDDLAQAELLERDKKKWAEEDELLAQNKADSARIAEENKRKQALYLEDLRAYKQSKHPVMFGWFAYWNPLNPDQTFSLDHLPDSVDFISNWGTSDFGDSAPHREQLARLREKGTRMTLGWIIENIGDGIPQMMPKADYPDDPYKAIDLYVTNLKTLADKYGYDGFDIDYEPTFASPWKAGNHCGDGWDQDWKIHKPLIACPGGDQTYENYFFMKMREAFPRGEKLLNLNGSIGHLSPDALKYFDYFVYQSYNNTGRNYMTSINNIIAKDPNITKEQFIITESFQSNAQNAIGFVQNYAQVAIDNELGGVGAFHINEDFLHTNYKSVREAIQLLNPSFGK